MSSPLTVVAVVVIGLQLLVIATLLALHTRQRRARAILQAHERALQGNYERVRRLAGCLINSREAVRTRIARDLHDDVCQELACLSIAIGEFKCRRGEMPNAPTPEAVTALQRRTLGLVETVRRLSHDLHPSTLRHIGLAAALEVLCIEIEQRYDVQVSLVTERDFQQVSPDAELCVFRIAQEALRNAAVHGNARRIRVSLTISPEYVELTVDDDGQGFDLDLAHQHGSLGLDSMEERAYLTGGDLYIASRPRHGTTIRARIPPAASTAALEAVEESV